MQTKIIEFGGFYENIHQALIEADLDRYNNFDYFDYLVEIDLNDNYYLNNINN